MTYVVREKKLTSTSVWKTFPDKRPDACVATFHAYLNQAGYPSAEDAFQAAIEYAGSGYGVAPVGGFPDEDIPFNDCD